MTITIDPATYKNSESYFFDASIVNFFRKTEDLPTTFDRKAVAEKNFWKSEQACLRTNLRLAPFLENCLNSNQEERVLSFFRKVRKEVGALLGKAPDIADIEGRFGPGSTYGDPGRLATLPDKMSSRPTITPKAYPFLFQWSASMWSKCATSLGNSLDVIDGNKFATVPKDCKKFRGIGIEPSINLFYQLGLGSIIKKRLRRWGLDLTGSRRNILVRGGKTASDYVFDIINPYPDGQAIHRRVAREASSSGSFATIDLSNASDTIATNLVRLVVPRSWFSLFEMLRSPTTLIDGKIVRLEKFSSMGNGFTFELETAIFACIAKVAAEETTSVTPGKNLFVYGDDIIIPTEAVRNVKAALAWSGFEVNSEKSFTDGPFRESCGGDYFEGVDVRPFFLKELPYEPQHWIAIANGIHRMAHAPGASSLRWDVCRRFWFGILDAIPSHIRNCRGPEALGDLCIHDERERWRYRWRSSRRYFNVYRPVNPSRVKWKGFAYEVHLAYACYTGRFDSRGVIPREPDYSYKLGWVELS